jgi:MoxR-like ATPase
MTAWGLYKGTGQPMDEAERDRLWPVTPPWRTFNGGPDLPAAPADDGEFSRRLGDSASWPVIDAREVSIVNAAISIRRPLLITGNPGSGKSSLAYRVASELGLGRVLRWPVTSRTTLGSGLYAYDAIGRARAAGAGSDAGGSDDLVGDFITLGPLGTALLPRRHPRVLLIDEIDKSDIDLPNDLLNVFEDGEYTIPELLRLRARAPEVTVHTADPGHTATVREGIVRCHEFPLVIITSNGEREFPPAFLRRCLRMKMEDASADKLAAMVAAHFPADTAADSRELVQKFLAHRRVAGPLAADQLLNAVHLRTSGAFTAGNWEGLLDAVWDRLSPADAE